MPSLKAGEQRAGTETEVTRDMVDAGLEVFLAWCPDTAVGDRTDENIVSEVYEAMRVVALGIEMKRRFENVEAV